MCNVVIPTVLVVLNQHFSFSLKKQVNINNISKRNQVLFSSSESYKSQGKWYQKNRRQKLIQTYFIESKGEMKLKIKKKEIQRSSRRGGERSLSSRRGGGDRSRGRSSRLRSSRLLSSRRGDLERSLAKRSIWEMKKGEDG